MQMYNIRIFETLVVLSSSFSSWLLRQLPLLPHFHAVRPQVVQALRQACQVENDPALVSSYIYFLALHTTHDSLPDLADLVLVSWLLGE
jgi:integrator complex subunit 1